MNLEDCRSIFMFISKYLSWVTIPHNISVAYCIPYIIQPTLVCHPEIMVYYSCKMTQRMSMLDPGHKSMLHSFALAIITPPDRVAQNELLKLQFRGLLHLC